MKILWFFLLISILTGCAQKIVPLVPLDTEIKQHVRQEFFNFSQQLCPGSLDADIVLQADLPGEDISASGILLAQKPGYINFRMNDPLGRAFMMLVSDGSTFTFADNLKGEGYTGFVNSKSWTKYVPAGAKADDLFSWLSGRLPEGSFKIVEIGQEAGDECCWFILTYNTKGQHHFKFDPKAGRIIRHLLVEDDNIVFDVSYLYVDRGSRQCLFPEEIQIESAAVSGNFSLRIEKIYAQITIDPESFKLTLPEHYIVHSLE